MKRKEHLEPRNDRVAGPAKINRWSLRFATVLEERFTREHHALWRRESLLTGWLGLFFYDLFLMSDYTIAPSLLWRGLVARLLIVTPCALLSLALMAKTRRRNVREACKLTVVVITGVGSLWIIAGYGGPPAVIGQAGLILIAFFGAIVFRISFPFAVATNVILFAEDATFLRFDRALTRGETMACILLVASCALFSLLANYRLERSERRSYLLLLDADEQQSKLQQLNTALQELSSHDGLTGLPNRRRFDEYSRSASAEAWQRGLPVSIVMADIDHFKQFNDTYGHLAGDSILAQVAEAVRSCVRGGNDLAARFGGEEFVIFLPGADEEQAAAVAERVVATVRVVSLCITGSDLPVNVTVSCGVASGSVAQATTLTELIARADAALYEAKRAGRDRVSRDTLVLCAVLSNIQ